MTPTAIPEHPVSNSTMNSTAMKNLPEDLARHVLVIDRSLDGIPAKEASREASLMQQARALDARIQQLHDADDAVTRTMETSNPLSALSLQARALDARIQQLLKTAGLSRTTVTSDSLPALESEVARRSTELASLQADAKDTAARLSSVRADIKNLDAEIKKNTEKCQNLENRIGQLKREILDRTILEDVWYWIFADGKKAELRSASEKRDAVQRDIQTLLGEIQDKQVQRDALDTTAGNLSREEADLLRRIRDGETRRNALRDAIAAAKENQEILRQLTEKKQELLQRLTAEKQEILRQLAALRETQSNRADAQNRDWHEAAAALQAAIGRLREHQPRLAGLGPEGYGRAETFPEVFSFGRFRFEGGDGGMDLTRVLPFPVPAALFFPAKKTATEFVREFLLRAFQCLPPESLEITVCDPVQMGASLNGFQGLAENRKPFPEQRFLTVAKDIEAALARLHGEIDSFLQKDCTGEIDDWFSYNAAHPGRPRLYRLLVMFDLPDQLSDTAAAYLEKIVRNGPKCGILPLLGCNPADLDPRRHGALRAALETAALDATRLRQMLPALAELRNLRVAGEFPCDIPDAARTADALAGIQEDYARRDKFAGAMETLWEGETLWGASSADGLEAAIGWREDDRATPVVFSIGRHDHPVFHTLLGGKTGSGKSNLIHVLLHSLCHRYSPRELNLFLLDYKESIEFNGYANPLLPHAAGIATESDVEYGLSVLRHLEREMSRRADLLKDAGAANLYEYRTKTGLPMPRILLVIDEFQRLFETPKEGEAAEAMLSNLLRQGRSAGIHLLLATQTLSGLRNLASARSLLSQISCRIALSCIPEDSMTLLQNDNLEAASLASPPQGIYNDDLGVKSANVKFIIPEAVAETRRHHLAELREAAESQSLSVRDCHVFDGTALPAMPPRGAFADQAVVAPGLRLLVGRTADFEENAVVADMTRKNLVVIARNEGPAGIRESVARGLGAAPGRKAFLLYTEHPEAWEALEGPGSAVARVDDEWGCEDLDEFAAGEAERKVVVLDGFENLRALRSTGYVSTRNGPSAAERLRTLVERPGKSGVQLVLCFRDYGRAQSVAKELLGVCDVRIGDASLSDPAKFAAFDAAGARDIPLPKGAKAILADRDADGPVLFRPFAAG